MKETYNKRKSQDCKCFKFKIDKSNLSKTQANQLKMQFVEAKWIYNYLISQDNIYSFDYKNLSKITHKDKNRNDIETTIRWVFCKAIYHTRHDKSNKRIIYTQEKGTQSW